MQKKRKPGKDEDNSMLELIAKLSEGYNRTKQVLYLSIHIFIYARVHS